MEDGAIIELYWQRKEEAIEETSQKYGRYLGSIAMNILHHVDDADECVNDTYVKTWHALPPNRPHSLSAFIGKIVRNLSINRYRKNVAAKRGGGEMALLLDELEDCIPAVESAEAAFEREGERTVIATSISRFLRKLDADSRNIFIRRYWYADSIQAIAQRYQASESKIKSQLFRQRNKLRLHLEKEGIQL